MPTETNPSEPEKRDVIRAVGLYDRQALTWTALVLSMAILVVAYWNALSATAAAWDSPQYSHGYLVPLFAAVLLWLRREPFDEVPLSHRWWGVGLLSAGILMRLWGTHSVLFTIDKVSFIPCLLGVFVMVGGLRTLKWAGLPLVFLVFMYPLPRLLVDGLLRPLQSWATGSSLFALQTLGVEAYREGNRIVLDKVQMGVVDACSGLRMLTIFLALSAALAMIMTMRPWWERLIIFFSAVPIALISNAARITLTGLLYNVGVKQEIADKLFHTGAGYFMMPVAMGLLFLEVQILTRLFVESAPGEAVPVSFRSSGWAEKQSSHEG